MKLINKTNLEYVDAFIETFGPQLQSYNGTKKYTIGEKSQGSISYIIDLDHTPYGCNPISNLIGINEELCNQLELSDEEKWSLLLHEIGHIVRFIDQGDMDNETFYLQKELSADSFAIDNGFCEELVSALDKLLLINKLTQVQKDGIKKRISHWKNILKI